MKTIEESVVTAMDGSDKELSPYLPYIFQDFWEIGDIREKAKALPTYDIIILGAIGPVFGDYYTTLTNLSKCLNKYDCFRGQK